VTYRSRVFAAVAILTVVALTSCLPTENTSVLKSVRVATAPSNATAVAAVTARRAEGFPVDIVRSFVRCWTKQDANAYAELFTDDFRFVFAPNDSAGNPFKGRPWLREDELSMAWHLFVGGGVLPPARDIRLTTGQHLVAMPDPRPGKDPRVHRSIAVPVDLWIMFRERHGRPGFRFVSGRAVFYVVRGDSAQIPADLIAQGVRPDSTRWWIERWEDNTAGANAPATATRPALPLFAVPTVAARARGSADTLYLPQISLGVLKARYR